MQIFSLNVRLCAFKWINSSGIMYICASHEAFLLVQRWLDHWLVSHIEDNCVIFHSCTKLILRVTFSFGLCWWYQSRSGPKTWHCQLRKKLEKQKIGAKHLKEKYRNMIFIQIKCLSHYREKKNKLLIWIVWRKKNPIVPVVMFLIIFKKSLKIEASREKNDLWYVHDVQYF